MTEQSGPEELVRLRGVRSEEVCSLAGAAGAALALVWLVYERILPTSGAFGFWLCWYGAFLLLFMMVCRLQWDRRITIDKVVMVGVSTAALIVLFFLIHEIAFTIYRGAKALVHKNFFTDSMAFAGPLSPLSAGGAAHAMVGTLEQLGLATAFTVPLSLLTALFMSEIGGRLARPVRTVVDAMSALPSIVAGLFILALVITTFHLGESGLAAAFALTVMMMPIVTRSAEVVIRLVPQNLREASYALGASQWRTVWTVVLPSARAGLTTAVVLGMARGVGETSPVLLTAGFTKEFNADPLHGQQVNLPLYIWNYIRYPQAGMIARGFGAGLTLVVVVLVLFITARVIGGRVPGELSRRQRRRLNKERQPA